MKGEKLCVTLCYLRETLCSKKNQREAQEKREV